MPNYNFVINSSFRPYTFQEMLRPWAMYGEAYKEVEDAYDELSKKAGDFKYLAEQTEGNPRAKAIYEGYANELNKQAQDLANKGLSIANRQALTNLKRRYQGEMGRLEAADEALKKELDLRRQMATKDSSILYAEDNLGLDSFLDRKTPNLYNISGNELYAKGAEAGKSASSRVYQVGDAGSTLGGYYRDFVQTMGYNPDKLNRFQEEMLKGDFTARVSTLPELQQMANSILEANGVYGNLSGDNLRRAQQQVLRGLVDGSVYKEDHNPTRDYGVPTWSERDSSARGWASHALSAQNAAREENWMYTHDEHGNRTGINPAYVDAYNALHPGKGGSSSSSSSKSGSSGGSGGGRSTEHQTKGKERLLFTWSGDPSVDTTLLPEVKTVGNDEEGHPGTIVSYNELPEFAKEIVRKRVGRGKINYYDYYYNPYKDGFLWMNDDAQLEMIPKDIVTDDVIYYGDTEEDEDLMD